MAGSVVEQEEQEAHLGMQLKHNWLQHLWQVGGGTKSTGQALAHSQ